MGCEYTIHIGKLPIVREADAIEKMFGIEVIVDTTVSAEQPYIEVGDCSFLKAGLTGELEKYIPKAIRDLTDIIPGGDSGKTATIDENLIDKINALDWENGTEYYKLNITKEELIKFLKEHMGEQCYSICW